MDRIDRIDKAGRRVEVVMSVEVTGRVWRESGAVGSELLVLLALADWARPDGVCWPSMEALTRRARLEERQVRRLVSRLVGRGELVFRRGGGKGRFGLYWVRTGLPVDAAPPWEGVSWETGTCEPMGVLEDRNLPARDVGEDRVPHRNPVAEDRTIKVEPSEENPGIRYPEGIDPKVVLLDRQLRGLRGYEPDERFFLKVAESYCDGRLDLEEQGIRIRGWFGQHRRRLCTPGFVLTWLHLELHPERRYRAVGKGGGGGGNRSGVGGDPGLEALGRG